MNREDIIRMAHEADFPFNKYGLIGCSDCEQDVDAALERFAALVAAAEREACAKLVWQTEESGDEYVSLRETIADAIRARGGDA